MANNPMASIGMLIGLYVNRVASVSRGLRRVVVAGVVLLSLMGTSASLLQIAVGAAGPGLGPANEKVGSTEVFQNSSEIRISPYAAWLSTGANKVMDVAWVDVDSDGDLDLTMALDPWDGADNVVIYVNRDGMLEFTPSWKSHEAIWATSLAWGDVDGDGDLDLAVAPKDGPIRLYRNDGLSVTSQIKLVSIAPVGDPALAGRDLAWGDMNGDGFLDLVVANAQGANFIFFNQNGVMSTASAIQFGSDDHSYGLALGHMDNDNRLDIVVANRPYTNTQGQWSGPSRIYLNTAQGIMTSNQLVLGERDYSVAVSLGDVDGDGKLDIAMANTPCPDVEPVHFAEGNHSTLCLANVSLWQAGTEKVYVNRGVDANNQLSIALAQELDSAQWGHFSTSIAWGDADNDGDLDLAVANHPYLQNSSNWLGGANQIYRNVAGTLQLDAASIWNSEDADDTRSIAWGDMNGDGALGLAAGNWQRVSKVYRNLGGGLQTDVPAFQYPPTGQNIGDKTSDVTWGDVDGDGYVELAISYGDDTPIRIFRNQQGILNPLPAWVESGAAGWTEAIAWGDLNRDGRVELAAAKMNRQNRVFLNTTNSPGAFNLSSLWESTDASCSNDIAWGDVNGDGFLDIAVADQPKKDGQQCLNDNNKVYLNRNGQLDTTAAWESTDEYKHTTAIALGDLDDDGDLDLAATDTSNYSKVYLNSGQALSVAPAYLFDPTDSSFAIAFGDVDGNGLLDIAVSNGDAPNRLYTNSVQVGLVTLPAWISLDSSGTQELALKDVDGDGDIDLAAANTNGDNKLYLNLDGMLQTADDNPWSFESDGETASIAWADIDNDGDQDLAVGNRILKVGDQSSGGIIKVFVNGRQGTKTLPNNPAYIYATRPLTESVADFFVPHTVKTAQKIPLVYTLYDGESNRVGYVAAWFSPNGGGQWFPALAAGETITTHLATSPSGVSHVYNWDTYASGFFGQADNLVIRMVAYPQPPSNQPAPNGTYRYTNTVAGPFQRAYASSTTYPFRVRGTQVRVYRESQAEANGAADALVYRIPAGATVGGSPIGNGSRLFRTDGEGYLQGRGRIEPGDQLVALLPITATDHYTVYLTNALPITTGLNVFSMTAPGVQPLIVSADNPLTLFNLTVSLEWDARKDAAYLKQLQSDLQRASELLYDVSNGQAALGNVTVYHARQHWDDADLRIYATNRLRPHATIGGVNDELTVAWLPPVDASGPITTVYVPGQIHMPAAWNRAGETSGSLGEDWPRTLVHEMGHYFFYLLENYMGIDEQSLPRKVESCPGIMGNAYLAANSEFHPQTGWAEACSATLQAQAMHRSDWEGVTTFYPWMRQPQNGETPLKYAEQNSGPNTLPLAVTQIAFVDPPNGQAQTLDVPTWYLVDGERKRYGAGAGARAFLFKDGYLVDLGQPRQDRLQVWGAERNGTDEVCVYDLAQTTPMLGCKGTNDGIEVLTMRPVAGWQPDFEITEATSRTLRLRVSNLPQNLPLHAQIYPSGANSRAAGAPVALSPDGAGAYVGTFQLLNPPMEARIRLWVEESAVPRREAVLDYVLTGAPALKLSDGSALKLSDGHVLLLGDGTLRAMDAVSYTLHGSGHRLELGRGAVLKLSDGGALKLSDGSVFLNLPLGGALKLSDGSALKLSDGGALKLSDGGALKLSDGSALKLSDGGALKLSDGSAALFTDGNGPILSSDGQVQIFGDNLDFPAGEFYALQSLLRLPSPPAWATLVGQGYRLTRSAGAPPFARSAISFRYLGRDVPPGEENFLSIYHYDGSVWQRLETRLDTEQNLAVAPIVSPGLYALMSSVPVALEYRGWNLFSYPVQSSRPVTLALSSLPTTTYGALYDYRGSGGWRVYAPRMPAWANSAGFDLTFGRGYWITTTQPITLYLKGAESPSGRSVDGLPFPPSTFYGDISVDGGSAEPSPTSVEAWIDGVLCGRGDVWKHEDEWVYLLFVAHQSQTPGCGEPGKSIAFRSGETIFLASATWDSSVIRQHSLVKSQQNLFLPLVTSPLGE